MKRMLIVFYLFILLTGCATRSQFIYEHPEILKPSSSRLILGLYSIKDERGGAKEIDKIYDMSPTDSINQIIEEEIKSTGLFDHVFVIPEDKLNDYNYINQTGASLLMNSTLLQMKWEVPNYDAIIGAAFATSVLTGGIGGMIYGSTSTDVYGDIKLNINVIDVDSGKTLLSKDYDGHYEEKVAKLKCDTPSTKANVIGKSLKKVLEEFKVDLIELIGINEHASSGTKEKDNNSLQ